MDNYRVIELLEYIKTFDEHSFGATKIALDKAIDSVVKIEKIKEILIKMNGIADSQEFGLHYGQVTMYLDEIEEIIKI